MNKDDGTFWVFWFGLMVGIVCSLLSLCLMGMLALRHP